MSNKFVLASFYVLKTKMVLSLLVRLIIFEFALYCKTYSCFLTTLAPTSTPPPTPTSTPPVSGPLFGRSGPLFAHPNLFLLLLILLLLTLFYFNTFPYSFSYSYSYSYS